MSFHVFFAEVDWLLHEAPPGTRVRATKALHTIEEVHRYAYEQGVPYFHAYNLATDEIHHADEAVSLADPAYTRSLRVDKRTGLVVFTRSMVPVGADPRNLLTSGKRWDHHLASRPDCQWLRPIKATPAKQVTAMFAENH